MCRNQPAFCYFSMFFCFDLIIPEGEDDVPISENKSHSNSKHLLIFHVKKIARLQMAVCIEHIV